MNEDDIFDLSREIMGDIWLMQSHISDANDAAGELDYESTDAEYKKLVNKIHKAVSEIETAARNILDEINKRAPEGYLEKEEK